MNLSKLSLPQRLAAGCGCVVVLALGAALILYIAFEAGSRRRIGEDLREAPAGWADSLRTAGRAPSLAEFTIPRDQPGNGAEIGHDTLKSWRQGNVEGLYRAAVAGTASHDDSTVWRQVAADTALDRFAAAARQRTWQALDLQLAQADSAVHHNILMMPVPRFAPLRNAARGLVLRGLERQRRRDTVGARADLGAAMSIGEQMFRREPSAIGSFMGRSVIASAAHGWLRFATLAGDTALAGRAGRVLAWASAPPNRMAQLLLAAPDTALDLARDTTLSLGVRGEALQNVMNAWLVRPRGFLFGVPRRYRRAMHDLANDPDPDFRRVAAMTAATADRLNVFTLSTMLREARR